MGTRTTHQVYWSDTETAEMVEQLADERGQSCTAFYREAARRELQRHQNAGDGDE